QDRAREVARNADAQRRLSRAGEREVQDAVVDLEETPRAVDHRLAARGEADAGRALVEEIAAEKRLQALDLRAHGRLRHPERLRRSDAGPAAGILHRGVDFLSCAYLGTKNCGALAKRAPPRPQSSSKASL